MNAILREKSNVGKRGKKRLVSSRRGNMNLDKADWLEALLDEPWNQGNDLEKIQALERILRKRGL